MKKAFVCFYEAYPPGSGAATVTYCSAKYSSGERLLLQVCKRDEMERLEDGLTVQSLNANADSRSGKIVGLFGRLKKVVNVLESFDPDVVVLEGASWVMYHYLLLRKVRAALPSAKVVYHSHNVELLLRKEKHGRFVCGLTGWAEGRILRGVDQSYAVSSIDGDHFVALYGIQPQLWPNGVDTDRFDSISDEQVAEVKKKYGVAERALLFMGLYAYKPNTEAVDFLCNEVMPELVTNYPDAQLVITGGNVPFDSPWLNNPGMIPFEDITALVKGCRVGVAPIFSGSGTRLKILEYMAAGIPVVSTRKGAEGLNAVDGKHLFFAESADDFTTAISRCLDDHFDDQLVNARVLINNFYAWPVALKGFESLDS